MYTSIADRRSGIWMPELCLLYPATGSRAFSLLMSYSRYTVKSEAHKSKGRDRYGFKAYTVGTAGGQLECEEYSYWLTRFSEATLTMNVIPDSKTPPSRTWGPRASARSVAGLLCAPPTERRQSRRKAILSTDNLRQSVSSSAPPTPSPSPQATSHGCGRALHTD